MKLFHVIGFRGTWTNNRNRCPVPDTDGFRITYPYMIPMTCSQDFSALKTIQMSDRILFLVDVDILTLKPDWKPVFGIGKMVDSYYGLRPSRHIRRIDVVVTSHQRQYDVISTPLLIGRGLQKGAVSITTNL